MLGRDDFFKEFLVEINQRGCEAFWEAGAIGAAVDQRSHGKCNAAPRKQAKVDRGMQMGAVTQRRVGNSEEAARCRLPRDFEDAIESFGVDIGQQGLKGRGGRDYGTIVDCNPAASIPAQFLSKVFLGPKGLFQFGQRHLRSPVQWHSKRG